ncbi:hypothetical protein BO83DRAFT_376904 [Aspergillus eucalypticola CBS 122712]|uniref:Uncharacterized protein n=1 Tax=Aspergillus eucalypticola (strain CBS 122712 / IBT 29274) TaxID=1448314 RepID=A0A317W199_ASPEC|nr:uncharacterized protein BO83DRAFT_376904 [Aspergillus eucalypticola CBS 122712]PWY77930.1 hypothetical protein BO83DRAFT_376904 [Aspergillus eucalypticola CBS 122712]
MTMGRFCKSFLTVLALGTKSLSQYAICGILYDSVRGNSETEGMERAIVSALTAAPQQGL